MRAQSSLGKSIPVTTRHLESLIRLSQARARLELRQVCMCFCVCMYVCMCVCIYAFMYVCIYVCMYVCMHLCMYVRLYVCMYVCTRVYTYVRAQKLPNPVSSSSFICLFLPPFSFPHSISSLSLPIAPLLFFHWTIPF